MYSILILPIIDTASFYTTCKIMTTRARSNEHMRDFIKTSYYSFIIPGGLAENATKVNSAHHWQAKITGKQDGYGVGDYSHSQWTERQQ